MSAASGQDEPPDHLVFVVHGVGDPKPADALGSLVDSYCVIANAVPVGPCTSWAEEDRFDPRKLEESRDRALPEALAEPMPQDEPFVRTFPVHQIDTVTRGEGVPKRTRFIEVYWGDLSRVKGTLGGLLLGTIDLVFGLRHIAGAAHFEIRGLFGRHHPLKLLAQFASWLGWAAMALMRAPMLALNIFAAIVAALFVMDAATRLPLSPSEAAAERAAAAAGAARWQVVAGPCADYLSGAVGAVTVLERPTPEAVYCRSGGTGIATAAAVCLLLGVVLLLLAAARGWSSSMAACLVAIGTASLAFVLTFGTAELTYSAFVESITSVLSVGAALMGFLVVLMLTLSLLAWGAALAFARRQERALRRALTVVNVCTTLSTALFVLLLMIVWAALSRQIDMPVIAKRIESSLHLFVVVWLTFFFIGVAYGLIAAVAGWQRRHYKRDKTWFPRFIIGRPVVLMVLVSAVVWPLVFVPTVFGLECTDGQRLWSALWVCDLLGERSSDISAWVLGIVHRVDNFASVAVMASIGALILLFAARTHFGTALDIVLDVEAHFSLTFARGRNVFGLPKRLLDTEGHSAVRQDAIWQNIVNRFCVVAHRALENGAPARVSVLAHSQGTMIALEALQAIAIHRKGDYPLNTPHLVLPERAAHLRFDLVTLGCPLQHLYRYYFPNKYDFGDGGSSLLNRWFNIHRADDFVGREVDGKTKDHPRNIEVGPRGHVNYWADREVLDHLVKRLRLL